MYLLVNSKYLIYIFTGKVNVKSHPLVAVDSCLRSKHRWFFHISLLACAREHLKKRLTSDDQ